MFNFNFCLLYNCSEDEEEALHRIFGSSDSESDFENFVAQNKQKAPSRRLSEQTSEELPTPAKEKPSKQKRGRRNLKTKKEVSSIEENERTPTIISENETKLKSQVLEVDKENRNEERMAVEEIKVVPKPAPRRAQFKRRPIKSEEEILGLFLEKGLDKEDVLMMKLAFVKLKGLGDEMTEGMHWAYYPHNILSMRVRVREGGGGGGRERERKRAGGGREGSYVCCIALHFFFP